MFIIKLAAYILFITLIIYISTRALWLVFLLFCFRFWQAQLSYKFLSQYIPFKNEFDYALLILLLAVATYFLVMYATKRLEVVRYVILLIMVIYVFTTYEIKDIFFFKDFLEKQGMWSMDYWKDQIKTLFTAPQDTVVAIFKEVWSTIWEFMQRFWGYFANLEPKQK